MGKAKFDGVVEAVHYKSDGKIDWVRAYLRKGMAFSDYVLLDRNTLIEHLKAGKRYMAGKRLPYLANTFETSQPLRIQNWNGEGYLVIGEERGQGDYLEGVPLI